MHYVQYFINLGAPVAIPIILTILSIILGARLGKSLRAGLTVGVGFIGLNLIIGLFGSNLGPAVQTMVQRFGLKLSVIDVGWPAAAAIAYATRIGVVVIPIAILVNIIMLITRSTQTVNIDVWNFWHFAFTGALVNFATGSYWLAMIAIGTQVVITLVLADWTAEGVEEYCGLPGVSFPQGFSISFVPIGMVVNKILDFIPGINKVEINSETIQKKLGLFGEPILIGTVLGLIIGIMGGYDLKGVLTLGITMGAVMVLIPKMAGLLMEGLIPISDSAAEFINKHFKSVGKMYIGLDSAIGIGHPVTLAVSLILVPLAIFIAIILPGNRFLPFVDLATIPFIFVLILPITKGNFLRTLIVGIVILILCFGISTNLAPLFTAAAKEAKFAIPSGATTISSIGDGGNPISWLFVKAYWFKAIGAIVMAAVAVTMAVINFFRIKKQNLLGDSTGVQS
jgi:PTS system galactitol-specific IIC component